MNKRIKVLILRPELGEMAEIDNSLDTLHDIIEDDIEPVYLFGNCVMYVGMNHKIREPRPPFNPAATSVCIYVHRDDLIYGTAIIMGTDGDTETDLGGYWAERYGIAAKAGYFTHLMQEYNAEEDEPHDRDID